MGFPVRHGRASLGDALWKIALIGKPIVFVDLDGAGNVAIGAAANVLIPEPSTWAMMVVGFAELGFAGYWRRRSEA
jgi:hypothetical protein